MIYSQDSILLFGKWVSNILTRVGGYQRLVSQWRNSCRLVVPLCGSFNLFRTPHHENIISSLVAFRGNLSRNHEFFGTFFTLFLSINSMPQIHRSELRVRSLLLPTVIMIINLQWDFHFFQILLMSWWNDNVLLFNYKLWWSSLARLAVYEEFTSRDVLLFFYLLMIYKTVLLLLLIWR